MRTWGAEGEEAGYGSHFAARPIQWPAAMVNAGEAAYHCIPKQPTAAPSQAAQTHLPACVGVELGVAGICRLHIALHKLPLAQAPRGSGAQRRKLGGSHWGRTARQALHLQTGGGGKWVVIK